jgi:hypothetical protein
MKSELGEKPAINTRLGSRGIACDIANGVLQMASHVTSESSHQDLGDSQILLGMLALNELKILV